MWNCEVPPEARTDKDFNVPIAWRERQNDHCLGHGMQKRRRLQGRSRGPEGATLASGRERSIKRSRSWPILRVNNVNIGGLSLAKIYVREHEKPLRNPMNPFAASVLPPPSRTLTLRWNAARVSFGMGLGFPRWKASARADPRGSHRFRIGRRQNFDTSEAPTLPLRLSIRSCSNMVGWASMKHTSTLVVRPSREEEAEERTGGAIYLGSMGEGLLFCCAEAGCIDARYMRYIIGRCGPFSPCGVGSVSSCHLGHVTHIQSAPHRRFPSVALCRNTVNEELPMNSSGHLPRGRSGQYRDASTASISSLKLPLLIGTSYPASMSSVLRTSWEIRVSAIGRTLGCPGCQCGEARPRFLGRLRERCGTESVTLVIQHSLYQP